MSSVHDYLSLFLFIHSEDFADEQIMVVAFIFAAVPLFVNNIILEIPSVHAGIIELSHDTVSYTHLTLPTKLEV